MYDYVLKAKSPFRKGYLPQYTKEIFTITNVLLISQPPKYDILQIGADPIIDVKRVLERDLYLIPKNVPESKTRGFGKHLPHKKHQRQAHTITTNSNVEASPAPSRPVRNKRAPQRYHNE